MRAAKSCVSCRAVFKGWGPHAKYCSFRCDINDNVKRDANGCWIWQKSVYRNGYGQIGRGGRKLLVHRVAYEAFIGSIPLGMDVCHTCDVRACCNPTHLFVGTRTDNMSDAVRKRRMSYGETHAHSKLTTEQVREIRNTPNKRGITVLLARQYGVQHTAISRIRNRTRRQYET